MSRDELAQSITQYARDQGQRHHAVRQAVVVDTNPLKFELLNQDVVLAEGDYQLTAWVRTYDKQVGLKVDDLVIVHEEEGDWTVMDVVSDKGVPLN